VAAVVLGHGEGADDVVQDAAIRALAALGSFRPGAAFRPWFLRIVANGARNQRRAAGRRARLALRSAGPATSPRGPEEEAVTDTERRLVLGALNRLRADDRLVIALRHFEELSEAEMSVVLGCPAGTVKSRLSRAMGRLRRALEEEVNGDD
jgi:RNA polymerase sigma-70 factor (ECF subfamily)